MLESGGHGLAVDLGMVARFGLGGRNVADGLEQAPMVEPVDPFEGGKFHRLGMAPGTTPADHLGLEQPDHRLGQGVVVAVADAADRGLDAGLGKPLGVADRDVQAAAIAMVHQAVTEGAPVIERLFQGIQDKAGPG